MDKLLLMCDQSTEMPGGDTGADVEESAVPSPTGGLGEEGRLSLERQDGGAQSESLMGEESRASGGEVGQEDEEMTRGSHNLSSSANHSPGSVSASTKSSENTDGSRGQAHREVMVTVAEMKKRIPSDKSSRRKAGTVEALHYALRCVKQVQANSDYYKLLMRNGQDERREATGCTLEELEKVTSEHTLKNTDSFVVVFSLSSSRVLHALEQAPSILCCKRKFLESAKFVELLFHQDVNVFYSHSAQPHLPPWSNSQQEDGPMVAAPEHEHCVRTLALSDQCDWLTETKTALAQFEYQNTWQTLLQRHGAQVVQHVYHINSFNCRVSYRGWHMVDFF